MDEVWVSFGHLGVRVCCADGSMLDLIRRAYGDFAAASPHLTNVCQWKTAIEIEGRLPPHMERNLDVDKTPLDIAIAQGGQVSVGTDWFEAVISPSSREINIRCPRAVHPLDSALRCAFVISGVGQASLLAHAAGVVINGRAYVLYGPSGIGKSTLARAAGPESLADEMLAVNVANSNASAEGTPFWQGRQARYPIEALVSLERAATTQATGLQKDYAMRLLWSQIQVAGLDAAGMEGAWNVAADLVQNAATMRLGVTLSPTLWEDVKQALLAARC